MAAGILSPETFRFFRELGRNNHKPWMDANRARYQGAIVAPLRALLAALTAPVRKLNPKFDVSGRTGTNFSRINRDIRFARDKSPYRTQMYLMFSDQRAADGDDGQLYVGISAEAVTCGFRIYGGRGSKLARIAAPRASQNAAWLARQAKRLGKRYDSYWYVMEKGEWTKRTGWPVKPEEWKKMKGWIVRRKLRPGAAARASFARDVAKIFQEVFPLYQFTSTSSWRK